MSEQSTANSPIRRAIRKEAALLVGLLFFGIVLMPIAIYVTGQAIFGTYGGHGYADFFGTLSAGLSSVFPIFLIAPLLIEDYRSGKLDTQSKQFRIITGIASVLALTIPVLGFNPIKGQLLSQVFNVFVLPLVVVGIIVVINNRKLMGTHTAGYFLNALLGLAFLFSILISYNGALAVYGQLG